MAIRCLFDAHTGCLKAFNTTRDPAPDEIVGVWNSPVLPQFGIVYDFVTKQVVPATEDQFIRCIGTMPHAGIPTFITGVVGKEKRFRCNQWVRVDYDIRPPSFSDPGGALLVKERGIYALFADWTVGAIGYAPHICMQLRMNGIPDRTWRDCKIIWNPIALNIHTMIVITKPPVIVEIWFWMGDRPCDHPGPCGRPNVIFKDDPKHVGRLQCFKVCSDWTG
ncbi:MAG: hypothetical protein GXO10_02945 [Crenarchaeota archaeon]|nr:hypothetical protein [Thermoproteota archaeon]